MNKNFLDLLQPLDEVEEEVYIQEVMGMGYSREEAINMFNPSDSNSEDNLPWLCM